MSAVPIGNMLRKIFGSGWNDGSVIDVLMDPRE